MAQSESRTVGFGKYINALSTSFSHTSPTAATTGRSPPVRRRRLHLLYLVNDLLHHSSVHDHNRTFTEHLQPSLLPLFTSAASFKNCPRQERKLISLLEIWQSCQYYPEEHIKQLIQAVRLAHEIGGGTQKSESQGAVDSRDKATKSTPFVMPALHGDQGTPWYDLPAGNLVAHIVPGSTRPINPGLVKPLQFIAGPAEEKLSDAVRQLLLEVNEIFGVTPSEAHSVDAAWDIDDLGQRLIRNAETGEIIDGEGYYGWSKTFCEKMKGRKKGRANSAGANLREVTRGVGSSISRSRSRSSRASESPPAHKRRRENDSDDDLTRMGHQNRHRPRSADSSRGRSRSSSRSRPRHRERSNSDTTMRSRERGTRSQQDTEYSKVHGNCHGSRNGDSRTPSPIRQSITQSRLSSADQHTAPQHFNRQPMAYPPQFHSQAHQLAGGYNNGMQVIPLPPPPPPNYQGAWPPPLPPSLAPFPHHSGWVPPPPPPPLMMQDPRQWQSMGSGGGGGGDSWPGGGAGGAGGDGTVRQVGPGRGVPGNYPPSYPRGPSGYAGRGGGWR